MKGIKSTDLLNYVELSSEDQQDYSKEIVKEFEVGESYDPTDQDGVFILDLNLARFFIEHLKGTEKSFNKEKADKILDWFYDKVYVNEPRLQDDTEISEDEVEDVMKAHDKYVDELNAMIK